MTKHKTIPLQMHKNMVIQALEQWPDMYKDFCPEASSAKEAIKQLKAHDGEWIVDGALRSPDEHAKYMQEKYGVKS